MDAEFQVECFEGCGTRLLPMNGTWVWEEVQLRKAPGEGVHGQRQVRAYYEVDGELKDSRSQRP